MYQKFIAASLIVFSLASCKTSKIKISDDLSNQSQAMEVKGNGGIQINQQISYGPYNTPTVTRSWTTRQKDQFILVHEKAQNRVAFTQNTPSGLSADVLAGSVYNMNMFDLLKGFEKFMQTYQNAYVGTINPLQKGEAWKFMVNNVASSEKKQADFGLLRAESGREIRLEGTKELAGGDALTDDRFTFGFEFREGDRSLGAVSVRRNGLVWLRNDLDDQTKLILSSIASALILRQPAKEVTPMN